MAWDVDPMEFMSTVDDDIVAVTERVARDVLKGVVSRTPVYTGRLRASWNLAVNIEDSSIVSTGGAPGSPLPPPGAPSFSIKATDKVIISNNQPYAVVVEAGGPHNPAVGMVAATLSGLS